MSFVLLRSWVRRLVAQARRAGRGRDAGAEVGERVRVGVLTTSYPRDADDPAGAFVAGFARWLAANGGEVEVVCADARAPAVLSRRRARGAARAAGAGPRRAAFSARLLSEAKRRARGWDAVVSHWLVPSAAVGDACGSAAPPGDRARLGRAPAASLPGGRALVRRLARRADLVYVAEALRVDGAPGRVVPMAIDVAPIAAGDASASAHGGACALRSRRLRRRCSSAA